MNKIENKLLLGEKCKVITIINNITMINKIEKRRSLGGYHCYHHQQLTKNGI